MDEVHRPTIEQMTEALGKHGRISLKTSGYEPYTWDAWLLHETDDGVDRVLYVGSGETEAFAIIGLWTDYRRKLWTICETIQGRPG